MSLAVSFTSAQVKSTHFPQQNLDASALALSRQPALSPCYIRTTFAIIHPLRSGRYEWMHFWS